MDVREKLIELLKQIKYVSVENAANILINNGVTVQEWIPVDDRLPEQADPATAVLGITKQGKCYVVYYYKAAINDEFTGFYDNAVKIAVTHWMPIPQPPKGE